MESSKAACTRSSSHKADSALLNRVRSRPPTDRTKSKKRDQTTKPPNGSGAQRPPAAAAEALPSTDARQDTSWTKALAVRCSALLGGARGTPAIALEPKFRAAPPSARQPEAAGEQDELHQGRVAASRREVLGPGALELARQRNMIRPAGPKRPSRLTDRALSGRRPPRPRGYRAPTPDKISPGRKRWRSAAAPC